MKGTDMEHGKHHGKGMAPKGHAPFMLGGAKKRAVAKHKAAPKRKRRKNLQITIGSTNYSLTFKPKEGR